MKIAAAAIQLEDGTVVSVPPPGRHHTVIQWMKDHGYPSSANKRGTQGFVTDQGGFVDRKTAAKIAIAAGQVRLHSSITELRDGLNWPPNLFSEDMW